MSNMAEKLIQMSTNNATIANNVPLVYEAGRQSVEDPSKIIEKSETFTTTIALSDISEFPHTVYLSSDEEGATVRYYPNNIYNEQNALFSTPANWEEADITRRNMVTMTAKTGGAEFSYSGGAWNCYLGKNVFKSGKKYIVSFPAILLEQGAYSPKLSISYYYNEGKYRNYRPTLTIGEITRITYTVDVSSVEIDENYRQNIQIGFNSNKARVFMEGLVIQEVTDTITSLTYQDITIPCELSSKDNMVFDTSNNVTVNYHKSYSLDFAEKIFWNNALQDGTGSGRNRFNGYSWTYRNFKPIYPIQTNDANQMFIYAINLYGDLDELMLSLGYEPLDFSNAISLHQIFHTCRLFRIGTLDTAGLTSTSYGFFRGNSFLQEIRNFILHSSTISKIATWGTDMFNGCTRLKHITISGDGRIPKSVTFPSECLTSASIENIVAYLDDTVTGQTLTLKTVCKETYYNAHSDEYADADTAWNALVATKPNWGFALN